MYDPHTNTLIVGGENYEFMLREFPNLFKDQIEWRKKCGKSSNSEGASVEKIVPKYNPNLTI